MRRVDNYRLESEKRVNLGWYGSVHSKGGQGGRECTNGLAGLFGPEFVHEFLAAAKPELETLIRGVVAETQNSREVLCVPYDEAGKRIGTTYEGIRKLVRKGRLKAVSRSGRRRG